MPDAQDQSGEAACAVDELRTAVARLTAAAMRVREAASATELVPLVLAAAARAEAVADGNSPAEVQPQVAPDALACAGAATSACMLPAHDDAPAPAAEPMLKRSRLELPPPRQPAPANDAQF